MGPLVILSQELGDQFFLLRCGMREFKMLDPL